MAQWLGHWEDVARSSGPKFLTIEKPVSTRTASVLPAELSIDIVYLNKAPIVAGKARFPLTHFA